MNPRKSTDTLVIHCADTPPSMDVGVKEIRKWHVEERGWSDIGYHVVIRRNGKIEEGRNIHLVGAHVEGHNATSIGICLVGGRKEGKKGGEENNFTPAQWESLLKVVRKLMANFPITRVKGHREFPGVKKYCPSFNVSLWLRENRKALSEEV